MTEAQLTGGIPLFLSQLIAILEEPKRHGDELNAAATRHGDDLLRLGFTIGQVVHDYGDVCQAVTELALERNAKITVDEFHTLNRCLDDAIAEAFTEYSRLRENALTGQHPAGVVRKQLKAQLDTAMTSFEIIQGGPVSVGGSTGRLLGSSLTQMKTLVESSPE